MGEFCEAVKVSSALMVVVTGLCISKKDILLQMSGLNVNSLKTSPQQQQKETF